MRVEIHGKLMQQYCRNGHFRTAQNTRLRKDGHVACRFCELNARDLRAADIKQCDVCGKVKSRTRFRPRKVVCIVCENRGNGIFPYPQEIVKVPVSGWGYRVGY